MYTIITGSVTYKCKSIAEAMLLFNIAIINGLNPMMYQGVIRFDISQLETAL